MGVGQRIHRITIQRSTGERTDSGKRKNEWTDVGTAWAEITTTGGGKFFAAQRTNAETTAVFEIRYTAQITPAMRIKHGARVYEILHLNNVNGRSTDLQIYAREVV